jgi:alkanesulfonate monooxygenase SsuD/methylene tetrahydromethanopterin reductase-like flavin-dependent oxidoreductase (luciferase family)
MTSTPSVGLHMSVQSYGRKWPEVVAEVMDDVRLADEVGLSSVLFAEHHFVEDAWVPRPLTMAAAAAATTTRLRVGSDIAIAPLVHPVTMAEDAAIVDAISRGRCVLGLGAGWRAEDFAGMGVDFSQRYSLLEQSVTAIRRLLNGEELSRADGLYPMDRARLRVEPVQPGGPPIWLGATGKKGIRRAAVLGDAWIRSPQVRVNELVAGKVLYDEALEEAGRPAPVDRPLRREAFVAETDEAAWQGFAAGLAHEYGIVYRSRHPDFPAGGGMAELQKWAEGLVVVGSIETVRESLQELGTALDTTEVLVRVHLPGIEPSQSRESIRLLGELNRTITSEP